MASVWTYQAFRPEHLQIVIVQSRTSHILDSLAPSISPHSLPSPVSVRWVGTMRLIICVWDDLRAEVQTLTLAPCRQRTRSGGSCMLSISKSSTRFDEDWPRYLTVSSPLLADDQMNSRASHAYIPGSFEGLWEGEWFVSCAHKDVFPLFLLLALAILLFIPYPPIPQSFLTKAHLNTRFPAQSTQPPPSSCAPNRCNVTFGNMFPPVPKILSFSLREKMISMGML